MPIDVSNLAQSAQNIQTYNPKFFSTKLTGSGKSQGVLNQTTNPGTLTYFQPITSTHLSSRKRHYQNGATSVYELPFNVLTSKMWQYMNKYTPDDSIKSARVNIGNMVTLANCQLYLDMTVNSIIMDETRNQNGVGYNRKISPCYQIFIYGECSSNLLDYELLPYDQFDYKAVSTAKTGKNFYSYTFTTNPRQTFEEIRFTLADRMGCYVDNVMLQDYLADYSLYENVCRESQIWQNKCDKYLAQILNNVSQTKDSVTLNDTASMLIALEQYPIPLDLYRPIYQSVAANFSPDTALVLCKQNLNLLLNDTLFSLNNKKNMLSQIPNPNTPVQTKLPLSQAQLAAVSSHNPLILVQSGAGSGKSTVILNRLNHMVNCGIDPNDITVISFTNAAADHIKEEQSLVHSMTACAMINTIYKANFPKHELNTMESLASTLRALYPDVTTNPKHKLAQRFAEHISNMDNNRSNRQESNPQTRMNNFIEKNLTDVLQILDEVGQTTLELQIIICYQLIGQLQEPPEVCTKYLIIDEVQDNSVFEFIYFLRYAEKHNASLFMVGKPTTIAHPKPY